MIYPRADRRGYPKLKLRRQIQTKESLPVTITRFNPGHYVNPKYNDQDDNTLDGTGKIAAPSWQSLLNQIAPYTAIRGISWRMNWQELDAPNGIASIKKRLEDLALIGKRLILHVPTRTFDGTRLSPLWARTATYDYGDHPYGANGIIEGYNINWYNSAVRAKMTALAATLATELEPYQNFEGVTLMESAYGTKIPTPLTTQQIDAHFAAQLEFVTTVKTTKPNLMVAHYTNVRTRNDTHIPNLVNNVIGIAGPDCWVKPQGDPNATPVIALNDTVWWQTAPKGLYLYYPDYVNQVPLLIHVQPKNYRNSTKDGDNVVPTITQLLAAAKAGSTANLQVNYMVWTIDKGGDLTPSGSKYPNFFNQVLNKLSQSAQTATLDGGLNSTYPSRYT